MDVGSAAICMEQLRRPHPSPQGWVHGVSKKVTPEPMLVVISSEKLTNNINQLNIKNQRRERRNTGTCTALTVGEIVRYIQTPFGANRH